MSDNTNNFGKFITFEGGEGVGKSTQIKFLFNALKQNGLNVIQTREPGAKTEIGAELRRLVKNFDMNYLTELLLFFADRTEHLCNVVNPALNSGEWVVCDRYYDSTLAYQTISYPDNNERILDLIKMTNCREPDLTLFLDADPSVTLGRAVEQGKFEAKGLEYHKNVRANFQKIADKNAHRFITLNAIGTKKEIHNQIMDSVNKKFNISLNPLTEQEIDEIERMSE